MALHELTEAITAGQLIEMLGQDVLSHRGDLSATIRSVAPLGAADAHSLSYAVKDVGDSRAGVILTTLQNVEGKTAITVADPRLSFIRALVALFPQQRSGTIHPSSVIHQDARIGRGVTIGPFCMIGRCEIGDCSVLEGRVSIYDGVSIGAGCVFKPGAVVGGSGFGLAENETGAWERFPHLGGVIIEDDVEIGANSCVDRGALDDTIIRRGAKIDNLVHIAHGCDIGEDTIITAGAEISGSVKVGRSCWFGPQSTVLNGLTIGDHSFIGIGVTVVKSTETYARVTPTIVNKTVRRLPDA